MARIISVLFHPIILIQIVFIIAIQYDGLFRIAGGIQRGWIVLIPALLFVTVLPVLVTFLMIRRKLVLSWEMTRRGERTVPFMVMIIASIILWMIYLMMGVKGLVSQLPLFGTLLIGIVFLINLFWKISIHMAGIGATIAFFVYLFFSPSIITLVVIIISGITVTTMTAFARLKLKAHNPSQLVAGWIAGFLTGLFYFRLMI